MTSRMATTMAIGTRSSKATAPTPACTNRTMRISSVAYAVDDIGVGGEDRQGDRLAQPLMALLGGGDRRADQHPLETDTIRRAL